MAEVMRHRSSYIEETSYDRFTETLEVSFTDGSTWRYEGVPGGTYTAVITANSVGSAFHRYIRNRFDGEPV